MKNLKIVLSIIVFVVIILLGGNVFADMDSPSVSPYKAYISNPNGAVCIEEQRSYDENGEYIYKEVKTVVPYGTEIKVMYEFYPEQDKNTLYVYAEGEAFEGKACRIAIKDITLVKEEFDMWAENSEVQVEEKAIKCTVLNPNGIQMYKGPAYAYDKMNITIPFGTEIEYTYSAAHTWIYVTYKGEKGWACILDCNIGYSESKAIIGNKCNIYDFYGNVIGSVPGNTWIEKYYICDDWSQKAYITYNGISGFVNSWYDIGRRYTYDETDIYKLNENRKIHEYADVNSKVIGNIPAGTEFKEYHYLGHNIGYYYVTYNGISGWITEESEEYYIDDNPVVEENNVPDATDPIINNNNNVNNLISENADNKISNDTGNKVNNISTDLNKEINTTEKENRPINPVNQILILAIGAAVIIAITSLVTILVMNKTKEERK